MRKFGGRNRRGQVLMPTMKNCRKAAKEARKSLTVSNKEGKATTDAASLTEYRGYTRSNKPKCLICMELPVKPVKLPCRCEKPPVLCLEDWNTMYSTYGSSCPQCKAVVRAATIRRGGGMEMLIDKEFWNFIQQMWPDELNGNSQGEDAVEMEAAVVLVPPSEGELQQELDALEREHRRKEWEQTKRDEEYARMLETEEEKELKMKRERQTQQNEALLRKMLEREGQHDLLEHFSGSQMSTNPAQITTKSKTYTEIVDLIDNSDDEEVPVRTASCREKVVRRKRGLSQGPDEVEQSGRIPRRLPPVSSSSSVQ